jgi:hypothetical protein
LRFKESQPYVHNVAYDNTPVVLHGNGQSSIILNHLANYVPGSWNKDDQCVACWEDTVKFSELKEIPQVVLGIFIEQPTPFIEEFFDRVFELNYQKSKMDVIIHYADEYHKKHVDDFVSDNENEEDKYNSVTVISPADGAKEWQARNLGIKKCLDVKCDFYFSLDSTAHLDNSNSLKLLIEQNRGFVAPMLIRPYKAWSNFWGALTPEGFYARSSDYMDIVQNTRKGLWNVPYVSSAYLIQGKLIHNKETRPTFESRDLDPDMTFCHDLRSKGVFMYISNRLEWGHLINADDFKTGHVHNELWEIINNQFDWERR